MRNRGEVELQFGVISLSEDHVLRRLMKLGAGELPGTFRALVADAFQYSATGESGESDLGVLQDCVFLILVVFDRGFYFILFLGEARHLCDKVTAMELFGLVNVDR